MKKLYFLFALFFIYLFFSVPVHCEVLWEKEFAPVNFVSPEVSEKLYNYDNSYFIIYFGMDKKTAKLVNGQWQGNKYPALIKIDENGNIIYQNENRIPLIDSLIKAGVQLQSDVRACTSRDGELFFDIPQASYNDRDPNIYSFTPLDGSLINIVGTSSDGYQPHQTLRSFFSDSEEFVLAGNLVIDKQSRVDVYKFIGDSYSSTTKYRITLNMDDFRDSTPDDIGAVDFQIVDDHYFIVRYIGNDHKTIIAKYSYDKEEASKLPTSSLLTADLIWYTIYSDPAKKGAQKFLRLDNKNTLILNLNNSITILNNDGEVIFNKVIFDEEKYKNYSITDFIPLKSKLGYFAFWGMCNDNKNKNFAILITDSDWNVVDSIVWDYEGKDNVITDIKEKENGNLFVLGKNLHTDAYPAYYVAYFAEVRPNYTGVNEKNGNEHIVISPNPVGDFITVTMVAINPMLKHGVDEASILIYNTLGEKVTTVGAIHELPLQINISALPKGIYFVKAGGETAKFVKM